MITVKNTIIKRIDLPLLLMALTASVFGIFAIYSATRSLETLSNVVVQSGSLVIGLAAMIIISIFDYEQFDVLTKFIYGFCILLLLLVLVVGSAGTWGARSWIRIGPIGIQPAEIAKLGFIITFARHLAKVGDDVNHPLNVLLFLVHVGVLAALIMCQPDAGSTMVLVFIFVCMLFSAGLSWKYIVPTLIAGAASLPLIYFFLLDKFQKERILVFLNPELDSRNAGYNVIQSKIAVGSGQFFGKGYMQGIQNQMGHLPTKHTDFIFSTIAEEFGFVGAVFIVFLLFAIIWRCITAAKNSPTLFGKYMCVGVAAMLTFHTFENIGMCMGVVPVTGIPLPFISYGGTSLLVNMAAVGLVMSVIMRSRSTLF